MRWKTALIGRKVEVQFHQQIFRGKIIDETRFTFLIENDDKKIRRITKNQCIITLIDEKIKIDGKVLHGRLEERLKNQRKKNW